MIPSSGHKVAIPGFGHIALRFDTGEVPLSDYFLMAARKNNPKRGFLFVSKLLGKHIPIQPDVLHDACLKLIRQFANEKGLKEERKGCFTFHEQALVIGFAETATAMGHEIFSCFKGNRNFVHTTRKRVFDYEFAFEFEEEHCHAVEQLFFLHDESWIKDAKRVIIVDDEVTTGNTILRIIEQINKRYPGKSYTIITFLDWRNEDNLKRYQVYSNEKGIEINFYSFLKGVIDNVEVAGNSNIKEIIEQPREYDLQENGWLVHNCNIPDNINLSARKGYTVEDEDAVFKVVEDIVHHFSHELKGNKRSVIGTGEFMYIPLLCAKKMPGENYYNATTRSPIMPYVHKDYGVKKALSFVCPYEPDRIEYLYNINVLECDEVVVFFEYEHPIEQLHSFLESLDSAGYLSKHIVFIKAKENG